MAYPAGGTFDILARAFAAGVEAGVLAPSVADFHRLRKMGVRYLPAKRWRSVLVFDRPRPIAIVP